MSDQDSFFVQVIRNRKCSRAFLAREMGVTPRVLETVERGGIPTPENAYKVAQFLGRRPIELWPPEKTMDLLSVRAQMAIEAGIGTPSGGTK
jgi:transcriptional regulator with XRE-family HTH domain